MTTKPPTTGTLSAADARDTAGTRPPGGRVARLRRRPLVVVALATATAVLLAGAADLLLERTARRHIVSAAACRLRPAGHIDAHLTGALAGLRLLTGEVGTIRISARDVRRGGTSLSVAAELHGVTTKGTSSGGTATATIAYDELAGRLGGGVAGLRPGPDGAGGLALTGTLAGIPLPVSVHTAITTTAGRLTVTPTVISVLGQDFPVGRLTASPQTAALAGKLAPRTVALPPLPSGVTLTGARAGTDGLRLALTLSGSAVGHPSKGCAS